jgi:hypothetical protein
MSNDERRFKNEEVRIRRTNESRITTNKVSFACPPRRVSRLLPAAAGRLLEVS